MKASSQFLSYSEQTRSRTVDFIMNPTEALGYTDSTPFCFREKTKRSGLVRVEEMLRYEFEERLREYDMAVFILVVAVAFRVMNPDITGRLANRSVR